MDISKLISKFLQRIDGGIFEKLVQFQSNDNNFEQNITYLVQDFGIVKDDLEFRWNSAPGGTESMVGKYRWEMINKNQSSSDCPSSGSSIMNAILNSKEHINTNDFENIDNFKFEPFKKTKTYGLQRVSE